MPLLVGTKLSPLCERWPCTQSLAGSAAHRRPYTWGLLLTHRRELCVELKFWEPTLEASIHIAFIFKVHVHSVRSEVSLDTVKTAFLECD